MGRKVLYANLRTFYFTNPVVTNKVQLDQLYGADAIAFKIEFLGLDMATRNLFDYPLPDKYMKTGKTLQIFVLWMYCRYSI
jgi:hypothetical protein